LQHAHIHPPLDEVDSQIVRAVTVRDDVYG
jgi:hypothetical protein